MSEKNKYDFIFGEDNWKIFEKEEWLRVYIEGIEKIIEFDDGSMFKILNIHKLPPYGDGSNDRHKVLLPPNPLVYPQYRNESFIRERIKNFDIEDYVLLSKYNEKLMKFILKQIPEEYYKRIYIDS